MIDAMSKTSDWTAADLAAWRDRAGLKQEAAADALGISARRIRDFEAGRAEIPRAIELACRYLESAGRLKTLAATARAVADEIDPPG